jgi:peptidoglycan/LPS O-acetylase OafA/YrhL
VTPSNIRKVLFSEPSGRRYAAVMFAGALAFVGLYLTAWFIDESVPRFALFLLVGSALSGIAEALPKDRRRTAGVLRVLAILVLVCLLALIIFAPEFIIG